MSHILFISHARGIHGAEAVMAQAIKACAAKGARVTVVVPSLAPDEGLEEALKGIRGVQQLALPYRSAGKGYLRTTYVQIYNIPTLRRLKKFVMREGVDTIYSNTSVTILGVALSALTYARHIWHWHEPVDARYGWHFSQAEMYQEWAQKARTIVCISRQQKEEWEQVLDLKLTNARIIYNPIKRIVPVATGRSGLLRGVRIGFIGRFEERKNIELLMQAFEQLHDSEPDTSLWLCGAINEHDRRYVERMTDWREPVVNILPQTPDVASFYSKIDILVLPSWRETMPLVVLEAMQAGVCVLQTNRSGMSELLEHGKETLFFPPDQPDILLLQLTQCMDKEGRQQIARAGQEKAMQLVNNQSFDDQITKLLCV